MNLNLLEEDSSSHNTIYDDENNIDYDYINKFNGKSNEKLYKKIVMRKRNLFSESFNLIFIYWTLYFNKYIFY